MTTEMEMRMEELKAYLERKFNCEVRILRVSELGLEASAGGESGEESGKESAEKERAKELKEDKEIKGFGYGKPLLVSFECVREGGKRFDVVISTMRSDEFGHQHFADRAAILLWQFRAFNKLPRHVRAIDVGYFAKDGSLNSVSDAEEFFIVCEKVEGTEYAEDLQKLLSGERSFGKIDEDRAAALASYLSEIHAQKKDDPHLYLRRIRELIGHSECIFGLIDSYPRDTDFISAEELMNIEKKCVEWRWKLKDKVGRLCVVHGDFHPWNVIFRSGTDFTVLDRSRGEFGEAADDLTAMSINYLFFSLMKYGSLRGEFEKLFNVFFETYLQKTGDEEILQVVQPFFAFRCLVIASPIWYPHLSTEIRRKIFNFAENVLSDDRFEFHAVNDYLR